MGSWMIFDGARMGGPRTVRYTDDSMKAGFLAPDGRRADADSGTRLRTGHVHQALRVRAGLEDDDPLIARYPLGVDSIALF